MTHTIMPTVNNAISTSGSVSASVNSNMSARIESEIINRIEKDMENNEHLIDPVLCVIAGCYYLSGKCVTPRGNQYEFTHQEGWIWFRN